MERETSAGSITGELSRKTRPGRELSRQRRNGYAVCLAMSSPKMTARRK
jgi:hypothetical protein